MHMALAAVLVLQQGDLESIEERNDATRALRKYGNAALPALEGPAKDRDGEISRRALDLIKEIRDPLHAESAEATLARMWVTLNQAKTLRVTLRLEVIRGEEKSRLETRPAGTMILERPGKILFKEVQEPPPPNRPLAHVVSDGTTVRGFQAYAPEDLQADMLTGLCKAGVGPALYMGALGRIQAKDIVRGRLEEAVEVTRITLGGNEDGCRIITYEVRFSGRDPLHGSLWCDLRTRLPRKRIMSTGGEGDNNQHFIESYEGWALDEKAPPDTFWIPSVEK